MNKSRLDSQASGRFKSIALKEASGDDSDLQAGEFELIDPLGAIARYAVAAGAQIILLACPPALPSVGGARTAGPHSARPAPRCAV